MAIEPQAIRPDNAHEPTSLSDRVRSLRLPDQPRQAPRRSSWIPWTLTVLLAASTAVLAYDRFNRPEATEDAGKESLPSAATTPSSNVTATSGDRVLESKGNVVPVHQIQVSPKVGGMVEKLYIEEGKRVHKGDVL